MERKVGKVVYNTEESVIVKRFSFGNFGDADGYEEILYQNPKGLYFLYVNGGPESKRPKANIFRMGKNEADAWLATH